MLTYGKYVDTESGRYSIDKLLVETWLPRSFDNKFDQLRITFQELGFRIRHEGFNFQLRDFESKMWVQSRFRFIHDDWDSGVIVELLRRSIIVHVPHIDEEGETVSVRVSDFQYGVRIMFNPNKHYPSPPVNLYFQWFAGLQDEDGAFWRIRRVDFAFDVAADPLEVLMVSRKEASYYRGTRYFGIRGKTGYTRIYDKAKREKVSGKLTRFEWEQFNEEDFTFDPPLMLGDLPKGYTWLKYVKFECINECLADMDKRTRAKVKQCFQPIPFDPDHFRELLDDYILALGLRRDRHQLSYAEYLDLAAAEISDMEKEFYESV